MSLQSLIKVLKGGAGSGNWGHAGRQGKRGGSAPKSGVGAAMSLNRGRTAAERQAAAKASKGGKNAASANVTETDIESMYDVADKLESDFYHTASYIDEYLSPIAERAGVGIGFAAGMLDEWNSGSDTEGGSLLQAAARAELGFGISEYQKSDVTGKSLSDLAAKHADYFQSSPSNLESDSRKLVKAIYEHTQEELAKRGIKELTLVRGIVLDDKDVAMHKQGAVVSSRQNTLSSWSLNEIIAQEFAGSMGEERGAVITAKVPASRVFSFWGTGPGTREESEVVLGNMDQPDQYLVRSEY